MAGAASQPTPGKPTEADDKEPRAGPPDRQVSCDPFLPPPSAGERGARGEGSRLPTRPRQKCFLCSVCPVGDGKQDPYLGFRVVRHPGEARLPLQPLTLAGTMSNKGRGQCLPHMDEGGKIWEL